MDVPGSAAAGRRPVRGRRLQAGSRGAVLQLNGARNVSVGAVPPTSARGSAPGTRWRPAAAGVTLLAAAGLAAAGCSTSSGSSSSVAGCSGKQAGAASTMPASPGVAAGWTLPGGNLQNTRDVASAITSANVGRLGVAWCVPVESTGEAATAGVTDGYATTPVVVNGVVCTQDIESNVMAIKLATGKVLWTHNYSSPNGGPDGVNVAGGTVYAATNHAAVALSAATGEMVAVSQDTGKIEWADQLPSSPYGAATVTNNVVFTTTYSGYLYAFNAATGAILLKTPLSSGSNAPVAVDGDYVLVGAGVQALTSAKQLIVAYKLGATGGKLPDTVGP